MMQHPSKLKFREDAQDIISCIHPRLQGTFLAHDALESFKCTICPSQFIPYLLLTDPVLL